jgi:CheY-like chemotaxis protein
VAVSRSPHRLVERASLFNKDWRFDSQGIHYPETVKSENVASASRRILVVDDEPFVCDAVKMMLAFDGHEVHTAANGAEALAIYNQQPFDLVITDFEMPKMKGSELAIAIKDRNPKQPVVMITAYAEMLESSGTPLKGVDFVLGKPFYLEDLRRAIARTLPGP